MFGEIALLDQQPRSASIEADEDLVCYVLTVQTFETLARTHHAIAIKLLTNIAMELRARLRRVNQTIYQLES